MRKRFGLLFLILLLSPSLAFAQLPSGTGLSETGNAVYGGTAPSIYDFLGKNIINPALGFLGVIFLLLMLYAGFLWMTSGGNSDQVDKAKRILTSAVIGTVIVLAAYAITTEVFRALGGATQTTQQTQQTQ